MIFRSVMWSPSRSIELVQPVLVSSSILEVHVDDYAEQVFLRDGEPDLNWTHELSLLAKPALEERFLTFLGNLVAPWTSHRLRSLTGTSMPSGTDACLSLREFRLG